MGDRLAGIGAGHLAFDDVGGGQRQREFFRFAGLVLDVVDLPGEAIVEHLEAGKEIAAQPAEGESTLVVGGHRLGPDRQVLVKFPDANFILGRL